MIFAGLPLGQLLAIFGAAGAVMLTLYILKLRRRTVAVPFSKLWERILKDKEATSLFSRLKRLLSLILQLALLALLVLALGDPRAAASLLKGRTLVVLVDASASMQATDVSPSRLGVAREETLRLVRGLGGADRMLVAQMDAATTPLGPMSGDTAELERALQGLHATDARADFPRALRFATDALRGVENAEIVVVSDGNLGEARDAAGPVHVGDVKLSFLPVGKGKRNVAVTAFSVRRYPLDKSRYEVMLEVTNTGPETEDIELSLFGDEVLVDLTKLRLKPGERLPRFYPNLSGASRTLEAKLSPLADSKDELPADDRAYALLPERRRTKLLVVTGGNTYLEAALLLDEYLDVTMTSPRDYAGKYAESPSLGQGNRPGGFDAIVFDGVTPTTTPKAHALYLDPRGATGPVKVLDEIRQPGFDKLDRKHPLVRFIALDDVNIAKGHKLGGEPADKIVGASAEGPILVAGVRSGFKFVSLGFDIRDSDLPLRMAWPLFLMNVVHWFTDEDAKYLSSFRTGEVWRVPVGERSSEAELTFPGGAKELLPVHEGRAVMLGQRAGFYELRTQPKGETATTNVESFRFAANLLDAEESAIEPRAELTVDGKAAGAVGAFHVGVRRELWITLLLIAVALTLLEWATFHRRLTV